MNPESSLGRLASLASLAPTRGSPRATLGFKTVFRLRVRIWRGSLHRINQTKISFIDRKTFNANLRVKDIPISEGIEIFQALLKIILSPLNSF